MGLFNNLFGKSNDEPKKTVHSVLDFIKMDLKNLPDDTFTEGNKEITSTGKEVSHFRKNLAYKECGLFDFVDIIITDPPDDYNVLLRTSSMNFDVSKLAKLVNDLYLIYGEDDLSNNKFSDYDQRTVKDDYWTGRMYCDMNKYLNKHKVMLSGNGEYIELAIFSPKKNP